MTPASEALALIDTLDQRLAEDLAASQASLALVERMRREREEKENDNA